MVSNKEIVFPASFKIIDMDYEGIELEGESIMGLKPRRPEDPWSGFPPETRKQLNERWQRPCPNAFEWLMEHHPGKLCELLESPIKHIYLAMAAEATTWGTKGDRRSFQQMVMAWPLMALLSHEHPYVRETAIEVLSFLFLSHGFHLDYVEEALCKQLQVETSPELCKLIRDSVARALDWRCLRVNPY